MLAGGDSEELVLDGHDRRGKPTRFAVSFAPLRTRADEEPPDGAILLVAADRPD